MKYQFQQINDISLTELSEKRGQDVIFNLTQRVFGKQELQGVYTNEQKLEAYE